MTFNFLAQIQGGDGPDVWEKEFLISASDFRDAAGQASAHAEELCGQVTLLEQSDTPMDSTQWLIWSHEHEAWWAPNSRGYVHDRKSAGRYSFQEACEIVSSANLNLSHAPHEAMVLNR